MPHHHYLVHTLLPALAPFLGVSAASGLCATVLLFAGAVEGTAATAAWSSVALSALSFAGVLVRMVANDRKSVREFDEELRRLRAENQTLHAKDADQEKQLGALRRAVRANAASIDDIARVSGSDLRPALRTAGPAPAPAAPEPAPGPGPEPAPGPPGGPR